MANVLHPQIDFHPRPVSHSPSPFGFGFGLGSAASTSIATPSWGTPTPGHTNPAAFHQLASSITQSATRPQKRRLDPEEESENGRYPISRDESMDRSPTPERPKRAAPKRARVVNTADTAKSDPGSKETRSSSGAGDDDVDIGVLLATLPPQSLLPLLSSLLKATPSLKATILPLIPRPTLEIAVQALTDSAKRLREAYPYSSNPVHSLSAFDTARPSLHPTFGQSSQLVAPAMRNSYIISRLRPHVSDYVSTCMSYFPYFSCIPPLSNVSASAPTADTNSASTIQTLHKDKFHPSETFLFLSAATNQIVNQPSLSIGELAPMILPRLSQEWKTWVDKVDELVNVQARMFGSETVRGWERGLDELAECKAPEISEVMRGIRDSWVTKVGWLIGRTLQQPMDEL